MKEYEVTIKIALTHRVEAHSAKEAEVIARDMGEYNADLHYSTEWKAKLVK